MDENNEDVDNIIILNDEEGNELKFELLDIIEYEDEQYIVLLPSEDEESDEENAGEVLILKLEDTEDEEESYVGVDDEETLNKVFEIFKERFQDEFDFVDEE